MLLIGGTRTHRVEGGVGAEGRHVGDGRVGDGEGVEAGQPRQGPDLGHPRAPEAQLGQGPQVGQRHHVPHKRAVEAKHLSVCGCGGGGKKSRGEVERADDEDS